MFIDINALLNEIHGSLSRLWRLAWQSIQGRAEELKHCCIKEKTLSPMIPENVRGSADTIGYQSACSPKAITICRSLLDQISSWRMPCNGSHRVKSELDRNVIKKLVVSEPWVPRWAQFSKLWYKVEQEEHITRAKPRQATFKLAD